MLKVCESGRWSGNGSGEEGSGVCLVMDVYVHGEAEMQMSWRVLNADCRMGRHGHTNSCLQYGC
jgi:hypothetical protein